MIHTGRHFLQIPGPTNVPDRVLRAMNRHVIDHRGLEFARLGAEVLEGVKSVFKTKGPVVIYPASGSGAWEAAIVNICGETLPYGTDWWLIMFREIGGVERSRRTPSIG
jgi:aspartate aminotransferase-like enzyme